MYKLSPSLLAADFAKLEEEVKTIDRLGAEYVHIDVMDGVFVPSITIGPPVIRCVRQYTKRIFDVHLMINEPIRYIDDFVHAGADIITVHAEACTHLHNTISVIKDMNIKAGVALNPATPISVLEYILEDIDMILIMTVNPGFGGQTLIKKSFDKIADCRRLINERGLNIDIEVDGGITLDNVEGIVKAGANVIVAGTSVFGGDIAGNIKGFKRVLV